MCPNEDEKKSLLNYKDHVRQIYLENQEENKCDNDSMWE
jgi:hypothetical protein